MFRVPFCRFVVRDRSMEPFLREGDHVLTLNWGGVKASDVIVFKHSPSHSGAKTRKTGRSDRISLVRGILSWSLPLQDDKKAYFVKRVRKISGRHIFVEGDNKKMSAKVGSIKVGQIVGKVILKY